MTSARKTIVRSAKWLRVRLKRRTSISQLKYLDRYQKEEERNTFLGRNVRCSVRACQVVIKTFVDEYWNNFASLRTFTEYIVGMKWFTPSSTAENNYLLYAMFHFWFDTFLMLEGVRLNVIQRVSYWYTYESDCLGSEHPCELAVQQWCEILRLGE